MSKKLGYTFYPKDWGSSESVFELNLAERGLYRELIDLAMLNDNKTEIKKDVWSRKYAVTIEELSVILTKLIDLKLMILKGNFIFIPSCENRLKLVRGGSNGGKKSKPISKPMCKPFESLEEKKEKPNSNQLEKERESELNNTHEITFKNFMVTDLIIKNLLEKNQLIYLWAKSANRNLEEAKSLLNDFLNEKKIIEYKYEDLEDLKSHITNWFKNGNLTSKNSEISKQETIYRKI